MALWRDVHAKRLHLSRRLGFHGSVIDIVNQRSHTSDRRIGGINNKLIIAALSQWVSFSLFFTSILLISVSHTVIPLRVLFYVHLNKYALLLLSVYFLRKNAFFWGINIPFYWVYKRKKNTASINFLNSLWYSIYLSFINLSKHITTISNIYFFFFLFSKLFLTAFRISKFNKSLLRKD